MNDLIRIAGAVIRNETGQFLLVQERKPSAYGKWNLPAGHVHDGESESEAAIREVKEETGFDIIVTDEPLLVIEDPEKQRHFVIYKGRIIGGELRIPGEEILDAKWLEHDEIKRIEAKGNIRAPWIMEAITLEIEHENLGN